MSITAVHDGALSRPAAPTPGAERQRRHRARRKLGCFVVPVEVTCEMVEVLCSRGDLDGYATMKRILRAVGELQGTDPAPETRVH